MPSPRVAFQAKPPPRSPPGERPKAGGNPEAIAAHDQQWRVSKCQQAHRQDRRPGGAPSDPGAARASVGGASAIMVAVDIRLLTPSTWNAALLEKTEVPFCAMQGAVDGHRHSRQIEATTGELVEYLGGRVRVADHVFVADGDDPYVRPRSAGFWPLPLGGHIRAGVDRGVPGCVPSTRRGFRSSWLAKRESRRNRARSRPHDNHARAGDPIRAGQ